MILLCILTLMFLLCLSEIQEHSECKIFFDLCNYVFTFDQ